MIQKTSQYCIANICGIGYLYINITYLYIVYRKHANNNDKLFNG